MYSDYYKLIAAKRMQEISKPYMLNGKSLRWIWINIQLPIWPISYESFLKLMGEANIEQRLQRHKKNYQQLKLF